MPQGLDTLIGEDGVRLQVVTEDGRLTDNYLILTRVRVVPGR